MLPCQSQCADYHIGCHKTCDQWRLFQEQQRIQRAEKKRYLREHSPRCALTVRQLLSIQARYPVW